MSLIQKLSWMENVGPDASELASRVYDTFIETIDNSDGFHGDDLHEVSLYRTTLQNTWEVYVYVQIMGDDETPDFDNIERVEAHVSHVSKDENMTHDLQSKIESLGLECDEDDYEDFYEGGLQVSFSTELYTKQVQEAGDDRLKQELESFFSLLTGGSTTSSLKLSWMENPPRGYPDNVETPYGEFSFMDKVMVISPNAWVGRRQGGRMSILNRARDIFFRLDPDVNVYLFSDNDLGIIGVDKENFFRYFPTEESIVQLMDRITNGESV